MTNSMGTDEERSNVKTATAISMRMKLLDDTPRKTNAKANWRLG